MVEEVKKTRATKQQKRDYVFAIGRRKEAVARVRLYADKDSVMWDETEVKKGEMYVNAKPIAEYFGGDTSRYLYSEPFRVTNTQNKYIITVRVVGGGPSGQLQATVTGIANALDALDTDKHRAILKKKGFLTRDARVRERRKVGTGGKARRKKQSPKR